MNAIFPELPTKLGIYTLTELLSIREHSELYLATQSYVDRAVVIEVLRPESAQDKAEAFQESARKRAGITLPQTSPVFESVQAGNMRYLIQEQPNGKSLSALLAEGVTLTVEQAFALVQAVAELYGACTDQQAAAGPLSLDSIYLDGDRFSFFSPIISGEITAEQHAAQMESLAVVLENALPEQEIAKSNISIILHWLRQGYGGKMLEWRPLAATLHTLRARKGSSGKSVSWGERLKSFTNKRYLKRQLRASKLYLLYAAVGLVVAVLIGMLVGPYIEVEGTQVTMLPAVTDEYVYCSSAKKSWRVMTRPVSIGAYEKFLKDLEAMPPEQMEQLREGMPSQGVSLQPLEWQAQRDAAAASAVWRGTKLTPDSPVCGVSYWGALMYARYVGGVIASMEQVKTARLHAGESLVEEWTSSESPKQFPYDTAFIIYPAQGDSVLLTNDLTEQELHRSFRIAVQN